MSETVVIGMLRGPKWIRSKALVKKATRHAVRVVEAARHIEEQLEKDIDPSDDERDLLSSMMEFEQCDSLTSALTYIENIARMEPAKVVDRFVSIWNAPMGNMQELVLSRTEKVVAYVGVDYGGHMEGDGWQEMRESYWFDLPRFFRCF